MPSDWRRYVAPAAFLLAVTVAVVLVRSGLESGHPSSSPPPVTAPLTTTDSHAPTGTLRLTTTAPAKKVYWTVKAGDTFAVISAQSGVSIATIEQLNPTVKSTSLYIGEKIRIK
jgi:LysM repeat protein